MGIDYTSHLIVGIKAEFKTVKQVEKVIKYNEDTGEPYKKETVTEEGQWYIAGTNTPIPEGEEGYFEEVAGNLCLYTESGMDQCEEGLLGVSVDCWSFYEDHFKEVPLSFISSKAEEVSKELKEHFDFKADVKLYTLLNVS